MGKVQAAPFAEAKRGNFTRALQANSPWWGGPATILPSPGARPP